MSCGAGYTSESSRRLWDEMVPPPTRKITARLTVSYAGFEGESAQLEALYKRGITGEVIGPDLFRTKRQLTYWTHDCCAPGQTPAWAMSSATRSGATRSCAKSKIVG